MREQSNHKMDEILIKLVMQLTDRMKVLNRHSFDKMLLMSDILKVEI